MWCFFRYAYAYKNIFASVKNPINETYCAVYGLVFQSALGAMKKTTLLDSIIEMDVKSRNWTLQMWCYICLLNVNYAAWQKSVAAVLKYKVVSCKCIFSQPLKFMHAWRDLLYSHEDCKFGTPTQHKLTQHENSSISFFTTEMVLHRNYPAMTETSIARGHCSEVFILHTKS